MTYRKYVMSNTGSRLQIAPDLQLVVQNLNHCDLTAVSILLGVAGDIVTNKSCPSFVHLMDHDQILQMIYDNGNLTLDGDKGCGAFYEIETILDEIAEWFSDLDSLANSLHPFASSNQEIADNITDDGMPLPDVSTLMQSICHYIKTEINITGLPLCLVDCLYSGESR